MSEKEVIKYRGKNAVVSWHGQLCIHIGECGRAKGDLFIGGRQPWCQPDLSGDDEVQDVVERCPTGALAARVFGRLTFRATEPRKYRACRVQRALVRAWRSRC